METISPDAALQLVTEGLRSGSIKLAGAHTSPGSEHGATQHAKADATYLLTLINHLTGKQKASS